MSPAPRRTSAPRGGSKARAIAAGPPRWVTFGVPGETIESLAGAPIEATLKGATIAQIGLTGLITRVGESAGPQIRVVVDPLTPPGRYEGTATIGKRKLPLVADVAPTIRVRTDPSRLELQARPGETVEVAVRLHNLGNVPTDVPALSGFSLLDRSGFGEALDHALREPPPAGKQRVDVLFDDLAESHGGEVLAAASSKPAGPVAPGATAEVHLSLTFSDRLRPGAEYAGAWNIDATHVPVRVRVPDDAPVLTAASVPAPARPTRARKEPT